MSIELWTTGIRPEIVTADQILRCRIAKPRGWKHGMRNSFWIGSALSSLLANPDETDSSESCHNINDFAIWWLTCCYPHSLNEHAMNLVEKATPADESVLEVVITDATPSGIQASSVHLSLVGEPFFREDGDGPVNMRTDLAEVECPEGHTRVVFIAPSLRVAIGMVAETEGLQ